MQSGGVLLQIRLHSATMASFRGKCLANLESCSRSTDPGWEICVPCYRKLKDEDVERLELFKPEKMCHYPGCWNQRVGASSYCKGLKHPEIRVANGWDEDEVGAMIKVRETTEYIRKLSGASTGTSSQAEEAEGFDEFDTALRCIDRMSDFKKATIAKYAIESIQENMSHEKPNDEKIQENVSHGEPRSKKAR